MNIIFIFALILIEMYSKVLNIECIQQLHLNYKNCISSLSNLANLKPKIYQTFIVYENIHKHTFAINDITKVVSANTSSITIDTVAAATHPFYQYPSLQMGRPSTLFIIFFTRKSFVQKILGELEIRLWTSHSPRVLIISFGIVDEGILLYAWKRRFVDVSLLQMKNSESDKYARNFLNLFHEFQVSQFNPFINKYEVNKCDSRTVWYRDKTKNLHGYRLRVGAIHDPPFSTIKRNSTGHVIEKSGSEIEILKYLSESLNFEIEFAPWTGVNSYGIGTINNSISNGLASELIKRNIEFIGDLHPRNYKSETDSTFGHGRAFVINSMRCVVPIIHTDSTHQWDSPIVGVVIIFIYRCFTGLFNMDKKFWTILNIIKITLGLPVDGIPKKLRDRTVAFILIMISMIYTTLLREEFLENAYQRDIEIEFNDLNDLSKWPLTAMADQDGVPNDFIITFDNNRGEERNLTISRWRSKFRCLEVLANYKNVTCLMEKNEAILSALSVNLDKEKEVMKVMNYDLWTVLLHFLFVKGSPFIRLIDKKLEVLRQSGASKMQSDVDVHQLLVNLGEKRKLHEDADKIVFTNFLSTFFTLFIKLNLIAVIIFIAEMLIK